MKFKWDGNFGKRTQQIFKDAGHDVQTVLGQGLRGSSDDEIFRICRGEKRCLVSLDLDFSDVTWFPPGVSNGIVVIRVPRNPRLSLLENLVRDFIKALGNSSINKKLWIVEVGRIRIHQSEE